MNWNEPALLEREFSSGGRGRRIVARLGFPRPTERPDEWACSFQLTGHKDSRIHLAHGVDGLQALLIAASTLRRWLDSFKSLKSDNEPYELVFPKTVPVSYGLEFHRRVCSFLDEQIKKKERQVSRKRLLRKKQG